MSALAPDAVDRWVSGLAAAALIVLMAGDSASSVLQPRDWDAVLADPARWDGVTVRVDLFTVRAIAGPDDYTVTRGLWQIPVHGSSAGLSVGGDVSVEGPFDASDGSIRALERIDAPLRRGKRTLGIGSLAVLALLAPSWFVRREGWLASRA